MQAPQIPLRRLLLYFLKLGTLGFGGPIALAGYMHRDLVEREKWITPEDYKQGLALAQLAPGPLAAQLAIYLGWVRARVWGATAVSVAFILPSFVIVLVLSAIYLRMGGLPWMQGAFYGIGAAVIAIIARSAHKLVRSTLGADRLLWSIFIVSGMITAITESEIAWIFIASGLVALFVRRAKRGAGNASTALIIALPPWLMTGLSGPAHESVLVEIAAFFSEAGAFVFGSGLAIVPFLYGGVVDQFHWLTERQFLDAVAVAMITPGPVVITVAFIGYLVAGPLGALVAAVAVFLPCYLFVVVPAPYFRRFANNPDVHAFVDGVTAAATGAIAGAAFVLGRRAIVDIPTMLIFVAVLALLVRAKRIPEPAIILAAGIVGILINPATR
jgi:chromate transporter